MNLKESLLQMADRARDASRTLALLTSEEKNTALHAMANALLAQRETIKTANKQDLQAGQQAGLSPALLDRLTLNDARIEAMAKGLKQISQLTDPVGKILHEQTRPNGLLIRKIRVPIGVIAMIYESRPNVTADVAGLCIKAGNAVILRGGSEASHSNQAIMRALLDGLKTTAVPQYAIQLLTNTNYAAVKELVQMTGRIDLVIPRGGESLINAINEMARVPVIKHDKGVCHTFVDTDANLDWALQICDNAKCQRPGVCNAMETLLIHKNIAKQFLPRVFDLLSKHGVEFRGDDNARAIIPQMQTASEKDWETEYLDLILAVRIVDDLAMAIDHINRYGSHHSDAIITESPAAQKTFLQEIDSAVVYVNASTRFTDGGEFGMGAEIGISTDKLHARGPMGLEELTTYKYAVTGAGQTRP